MTKFCFIAARTQRARKKRSITPYSPLLRTVFKITDTDTKKKEKEKTARSEL